MLNVKKIKTFGQFLAVFLLMISFVFASFVSSQEIPSSLNSLPSWNEGETKSAILDFVERVTTEDSPDFIPIENRIATFDNDGTLWAEQPIIQGMFVLSKLKAEMTKDPSLKDKPIFQALLSGDVEYLNTASGAEVIELLAAINAGMTAEKLEQDVQQFFQTQTHPTLGVPYTKLAFQPMVELLEYLRGNGFQTWICSGGGIDFIRQVSQSLYGIPPQQVIGSSIKKEFVLENGQPLLKQVAELGSYNDKASKPVNIDLHIGQPPVLAVGNVRSGGDIAMLTYSQTYPGSSFQLLINHDDRDREFAYNEPNNASLKVAEAKGWTVVSMKEDWKTIFTFQSID